MGRSRRGPRGREPWCTRAPENRERGRGAFTCEESRRSGPSRAPPAVERLLVAPENREGAKGAPAARCPGESRRGIRAPAFSTAGSATRSTHPPRPSRPSPLRDSSEATPTRVLDLGVRQGIDSVLRALRVLRPFAILRGIRAPAFSTAGSATRSTHPSRPSHPSPLRDSSPNGCAAARSRRREASAGARPSRLRAPQAQTLATADATR